MTTRKVSLSSKTKDRPTPAEPRTETVSKRPKRQRVSGFRDILTVQGQDPDFVYRFVKDVDGFVTNKDGSFYMQEGQRIMRFKAAGWEFVEAGTVTVGENHVYKTDNVGSIVRLPAGQNEFLYLMRIHRDWYEEDQQEKEKEILDLEDQFTGDTEGDGRYGSVSITHD